MKAQAIRAGYPFLSLERKLRPVAAIEEVDHQPDGQPDDEAPPSEDVQASHEQEAEDHAEYRNDRAEGNAESTFALRFAITQHHHADGNQDEGKQRTDVGEVG